MECTCIRHTELPHATKLFADLVYHPERVRAFYPYPPSDPESYSAAARQVNLSVERRAALVSVLREQNGPSASLDLLAKPETVAVVTGQQVGLYSGPAYTVYKALTAARLASELTRLCTERSRLLAMAERARSLARPQAAAQLADACVELARSAP